MGNLSSHRLGLLGAAVAILLLSLPVQAQRFGDTILIADDEIIITEPENLYRPGAVYVYRSDNGSWVERAKITAPDEEMGDHFGESVAVEGDLLLVGSGGVDGRPGAAYLFERQGDEWTYLQTLSADGVGPDDRFGAGVAVAGDFLFVGAPGSDETPGRVFVWKRGGDGTWSVHSELAGTAAAEGSTFGVVLAVDEGNAFIGAPRQNEGAGAVYRFRYDAAADAWTEAQILSGGAVSEGDRLGSALDLAGEMLIAGAPQFGNRIGAAVIYEPDADSGDWQATGLLLPYVASNPSGFGSAVAISGSDLWLGAPMANRFAGTVYSFTQSADEWTTSSTLKSNDLESRDMFGRTLDVAGDLAAVGIVGEDFGAGSVGVFERDADGLWTETARLESDAAGLSPVTGGQVDCENGAATLFDCDRVDLLSFLPISSLGGDRGVQLNDIWGWTDPESRREYAIVGRVNGTSFVDVTDPYSPIYLGDLPKPEGTRSAVWRDIKVYRNHAFVVADNAGSHGMQVFDLTQLRSVGNEPVTFEETANYDGINSAHNIVINTETGFAYAVGSSGGGETCGGGLHMINIQDPLNPTFAGCYSAEGTGRAGTGYTHDAQCFVYHGPDADYRGREICFGSNETALNVADVTDKASPVSVATASYPNVSYTHQGWISEDHRYFYVNDELDELTGNASETRTLIWDVTDLDDPQLVREYTWGTKASDHNLYVRGNRMYMSNYVSGLRVHDVTDPENPVEIGFFDTMPIGENEAGFAGSWSNYPFFESGTIAVSSIGEGLFLLKPREQHGL